MQTRLAANFLFVLWLPACLLAQRERIGIRLGVVGAVHAATYESAVAAQPELRLHRNGALVIVFGADDLTAALLLVSAPAGAATAPDGNDESDESDITPDSEDEAAPPGEFFVALREDPAALRVYLDFFAAVRVRVTRAADNGNGAATWKGGHKFIYSIGVGVHVVLTEEVGKGS